MCGCMLVVGSCVSTVLVAVRVCMGRVCVRSCVCACQCACAACAARVRVAVCAPVAVYALRVRVSWCVCACACVRACVRVLFCVISRGFCFFVRGVACCDGRGVVEPARLPCDGAPLPATADGVYQVFVQADVCVVLTVSAGLTVGDVKAVVGQKCALEPSMFWLALHDKPLVDGLTLGQCNAGPRCQLAMRLRLRGGGNPQYSKAILKEHGLKRKSGLPFVLWCRCLR